VGWLGTAKDFATAAATSGIVDRNIKRTYHAFIVIKEAMMQRAAVETLRDFAELVSLGAFLTMIALAARAFGA
jgi:hypothetical protein